MTEETTVVVRPTATTPAAGQLITSRLSFNQCMAMIKKDKVVGGAPIPDYLTEDGVDTGDGLDMLGDMIKPSRLRVVQSMSKELKDLGFAEGDAVVTPINQKVGDRANSMDVIVLLAWADYLCLNPRGAGLFWIRSSSTDPRSVEATKARKMEKEPIPEGTIDPKTKSVYMMEYVKACNFLLYLPNEGIVVLATWMKGECKFGEAFSSLLMARSVDIYKSMFRLSVQKRTNARNESWDGLSASNSPTNSGWCPKELLPAMKGLHLYYRDQWAAKNIDANYDDMTEPQVEKVNTDEF